MRELNSGRLWTLSDVTSRKLMLGR